MHDTTITPKMGVEITAKSLEIIHENIIKPVARCIYSAYYKWCFIGWQVARILSTLTRVTNGIEVELTICCRKEGMMLTRNR